MMRKRNNMRSGGGQQGRDGGHRGGSGGRRFHNNGGGGNRGANDGQNLQRQKQHAMQQLGKYQDMARNAQMGGDRADVEYYLQHVEHYSRVLADIATVEAERFAHHREQHGQGSDEAQQSGEGAEQQQADAGNGEQAPAEMGRRMPRQPRQPRPQRSHYSPPLEERNQNTESSVASDTSGGEIPLPSLPTI